MERIVLAGAGFLLLAASLVAKKKAGCLAVTGGATLVALAARESDPTLALGALALVAARCLRPPRKGPPAGTGVGQADGRSAPPHPSPERS